jgi:hypothetical protein
MTLRKGCEAVNLVGRRFDSGDRARLDNSRHEHFPEAAPQCRAR